MKAALALAASLGICIALVRSTAADAPAGFSTDASVIQRLLHPSAPRLQTYRARRTLTASSMGGRLRAEIEAWTSVDADGIFRFDITRESGSALIRKRVLREALETEERTHNQGNTEAALTLENYEFLVQTPEDGGSVTIGLRPRRPSPMLLTGTAIVHEDGGVARIDGTLSKTPSWWTRHVEIARRYARINGVPVPVEMSSRADVRIAGDSTFLMTYEYAAVNERPVADTRPIYRAPERSSRSSPTSFHPPGTRLK